MSDKPKAEIIVLESNRAEMAADMKGRFQRLQDRAVARLEYLTDPERTYKDSAEVREDGWITIAKEAQAFKMILGDLLAGQIHAAKRTLANENGEADDDDNDDEELAKIHAGA